MTDTKPTTGQPTWISCPNCQGYCGQPRTDPEKSWCGHCGCRWNENMRLSPPPPAPRAEQAEGWVLVPSEPTVEMCRAVSDNELYDADPQWAANVYCAMLAAAPALKPEG